MKKPEYLKFRCCMCPQHTPNSQICPGIPKTPHPEPSPCRFVKMYQDRRGWKYWVRAGIGHHNFKTFYLKPGKVSEGHAYQSIPWRDSFDEAQADLNELAEKKGWTEVTA